MQLDLVIIVYIYSPLLLKTIGNKTYIIYQLCYQISHSVFKHLIYIYIYHTQQYNRIDHFSAFVTSSLRCLSKNFKDLDMSFEELQRFRSAFREKEVDRFVYLLTNVNA